MHTSPSLLTLGFDAHSLVKRLASQKPFLVLTSFLILSVLSANGWANPEDQNSDEAPPQINEQLSPSGVDSKDFQAAAQGEPVQISLTRRKAPENKNNTLQLQLGTTSQVLYERMIVEAFGNDAKVPIQLRLGAGLILGGEMWLLPNGIEARSTFASQLTTLYYDRIALDLEVSSGIQLLGVENEDQVRKTHFRIFLAPGVRLKTEDIAAIGVQFQAALSLLFAFGTDGVTPSICLSIGAGF